MRDGDFEMINGSWQATIALDTAYGNIGIIKADRQAELAANREGMKFFVVSDYAPIFECESDMTPAAAMRIHDDMVREAQHFYRMIVNEINQD